MFLQKTHERIPIIFVARRLGSSAGSSGFVPQEGSQSGDDGGAVISSSWFGLKNWKIMTTECTAEPVLQYWILSSVIQIHERLEDTKYEAGGSTIGGS